MKQEQVQDFTRKITQSNRTGLVVVIYEIIFEYFADAKNSLESDDYQEFKNALHKAGRGIDELIQSLDFRYEISKNLYSLYVFAKELVEKAIVKKKTDEIDAANRILTSLYEGFLEAAKQDHSAPLMKNTQQIYAGMTYGRNHLTETFQEPETSRGFFA